MSGYIGGSKKVIASGFTNRPSNVGISEGVFKNFQTWVDFYPLKCPDIQKGSSSDNEISEISPPRVYKLGSEIRN